MATWNKFLHALTEDDILRISKEYLLGWRGLQKKYHIQLKGLNSRRAAMGLKPISDALSCKYRIQYIRDHFTEDEIIETLWNYMLSARVAETRWEGIELFGCRFGREYSRLFRLLIGSDRYQEFAEKARVQKLAETQTSLYGGVGLAGDQTKEKAKNTVIERYHADNVMHNSDVRQRLEETNLKKYGSVSPFGSKDIQSVIRDMRSKNLREAIQVYKQTGYVDKQLFKQAPHEFYIMQMLVDRFGVNDVYYQYGIHPSDPRYPYNCDFYIKSLDLFIEQNGHYTHGSHWFDPNNHDDVLRVQHLRANGTKKCLDAIHTWTVSDVEKRIKAKSSGIRYLVFWDGRRTSKKDGWIPCLSDFRKWLYEYNADYDRFIADYPCNTY